ncbi:hypothetical protein B0I35DRAFT_409722 [Stachybotrys elegans]|uniref:Uncharacterized protein n=1 Tax=Stachybotrys elegans TaxID=80388 RepID=A0A8K0WQ76_9HYPO|nr:hypothetical protein B0I35DRAFT_409722 [Stachybotrys elegans]
MSPDTVSSLFPDRPIRPLPKRRLRERLSPEVADSIKYPASAHETSPLFYYPPYTVKEDGSSPHPGSTSPTEYGRRGDVSRSYGVPRGGVDGDEEESVLRSTLVTRSPPEILSRESRRLSRHDQPRHADPQPPPSATSSVDGYDSFENTNNKKKRKIPSAGDSAMGAIGGAHALNGELSALALSARAHSPVGEAVGDRSYNSSAAYAGAGSLPSSSQGISGPGRGRLGRSRNGRSPLRTLPDGNNTWAGRPAKGTTPQWAQSASLADYEGKGIISSAIANAEKLPPQGSENISLLQQHSSSNKATPASTQFTFTCDSQVPGTVQWPGQSTRQSAAHNMSQSQTKAGVNNDAANRDGSAKPSNDDSFRSRRKLRRALDKELAAAARHRRQMAHEANVNNPPKKEDIWICGFCEYEDIFGVPPNQLIRGYELKDRKARLEAAEKQRLLDKAKARNRRGRKAAKTPPKPEHPLHPEPGHAADPAGGGSQGHSHSTQSEGDYEDDFDDDYSNPAPDTIATRFLTSGGSQLAAQHLLYCVEKKEEEKKKTTKTKKEKARTRKTTLMLP